MKTLYLTKFFYFLSLLFLLTSQVTKASECPSKDNPNYFFEEPIREEFASFRDGDFMKCEYFKYAMMKCGGREYETRIGKVIRSKTGQKVAGIRRRDGIPGGIIYKPITCIAKDGYQLMDKGFLIEENDRFYEIIGANTFWTYRNRLITPYEKLIPDF